MHASANLRVQVQVFMEAQKSTHGPPRGAANFTARTTSPTYPGRHAVSEASWGRTGHLRLEERGGWTVHPLPIREGGLGRSWLPHSGQEPGRMGEAGRRWEALPWVGWEELRESQRPPHILDTPHSCCASNSMGFKQVFKSSRSLPTLVQGR